MAVLYRITSPSGKQYIGISVNYRKRMNDHRQASAKGGTRLYAAIRKYKWESFSFEVLVVGSFEYVKQLEVKAIAAFNTLHPHGYNMTEGGDGCTGRKASRRTLAKMRRAAMGRTLDDEHRAKISVKMKQVCDDEWRRRRAESQRKLWADPQYKARLLAKRGPRKVQSS